MFNKGDKVQDIYTNEVFTVKKAYIQGYDGKPDQTVEFEPTETQPTPWNKGSNLKLLAAETIASLIKKHGDLEAGIYYPVSQQIVKLPELLVSGERIGVSFYIGIEDFSFFVEENPGNANGSFFRVYYDSGVLPMDIARQVKSLIKNNQDAIGISFQNVNLN